MGWFYRLIADRQGNPNEHIVAALWGSFILALLALYLTYTGHAPTLTEYGVGHGAVWGAAGAGTALSKDNTTPAKDPGN